jgi:hypothetical protein
MHDLARRQGCSQPVLGVVGEVQPADVALRVAQGRLDGVHPVDLDEAGPCPGRATPIAMVGVTALRLSRWP